MTQTPYLFLSYDNYEPGFDGAKHVMSQPLRRKETQDRLWRGPAFNDLQAVSTDHCPFCLKEQKTLGANDFAKIPNGAQGIETRMSLVCTTAACGLAASRSIDSSS